MEDALEGVAKLSVEDAVDDRIHRTVEVTEPRERAKQERRDAAAAERRYHVDSEEWNPTEQEHAHDDAQSDSCLVVGHASTPATAHGRPSRGQPITADRHVIDDQGRFGVVAGGSIDDLGVPAGVAVESVVEERHSKAWQIE